MSSELSRGQVPPPGIPGAYPPPRQVGMAGRYGPPSGGYSQPPYPGPPNGPPVRMPGGPPIDAFTGPFRPRLPNPGIPPAAAGSNPFRSGVRGRHPKSSYIPYQGPPQDRQASNLQSLPPSAQPPMSLPPMPLPTDLKGTITTSAPTSLEYKNMQGSHSWPATPAENSITSKRVPPAVNASVNGDTFTDINLSEEPQSPPKPPKTQTDQDKLASMPAPFAISSEHQRLKPTEVQQPKNKERPMKYGDPNDLEGEWGSASPESDDDGWDDGELPENDEDWEYKKPEKHKTSTEKMNQRWKRRKPKLKRNQLTREEIRKSLEATKDKTMYEILGWPTPESHKNFEKSRKKEAVDTSAKKGSSEEGESTPSYGSDPNEELSSSNGLQSPVASQGTLSVNGPNLGPPPNEHCFQQPRNAQGHQNPLHSTNSSFSQQPPLLQNPQENFAQQQAQPFPPSSSYSQSHNPHPGHQALQHQAPGSNIQQQPQKEFFGQSQGHLQQPPANFFGRPLQQPSAQAGPPASSLFGQAQPLNNPSAQQHAQTAASFDQAGQSSVEHPPQQQRQGPGNPHQSFNATAFFNQPPEMSIQKQEQPSASSLFGSSQNPFAHGVQSAASLFGQPASNQQPPHSSSAMFDQLGGGVPQMHLPSQNQPHAPAASTDQQPKSREGTQHKSSAFDESAAQFSHPPTAQRPLQREPSASSFFNSFETPNTVLQENIGQSTAQPTASFLFGEASAGAPSVQAMPAPRSLSEEKPQAAFLPNGGKQSAMPITDSGFGESPKSFQAMPPGTIPSVTGKQVPEHQSQDSSEKVLAVWQPGVEQEAPPQVTEHIQAEQQFLMQSEPQHKPAMDRGYSGPPSGESSQHRGVEVVNKVPLGPLSRESSHHSATGVGTRVPSGPPSRESSHHGGVDSGARVPSGPPSRESSHHGGTDMAARLPSGPPSKELYLHGGMDMGNRVPSAQNFNAEVPAPANVGHIGMNKMPVEVTRQPSVSSVGSEERESIHSLVSPTDATSRDKMAPLTSSSQVQQQHGFHQPQTAQFPPETQVPNNQHNQPLNYHEPVQQLEQQKSHQHLQQSSSFNAPQQIHQSSSYPQVPQPQSPPHQRHHLLESSSDSAFYTHVTGSIQQMPTHHVVLQQNLEHSHKEQPRSHNFHPSSNSAFYTPKSGSFHHMHPQKDDIQRNHDQDLKEQSMLQNLQAGQHVPEHDMAQQPKFQRQSQNNIFGQPQMQPELAQEQKQPEEQQYMQRQSQGSLHSGPQMHTQFSHQQEQHEQEERRMQEKQKLQEQQILYEMREQEKKKALQEELELRERMATQQKLKEEEELRNKELKEQQRMAEMQRQQELQEQQKTKEMQEQKDMEMRQRNAQEMQRQQQFEMDQQRQHMFQFQQQQMHQSSYSQQQQMQSQYAMQQQQANSQIQEMQQQQKLMQMQKQKELDEQQKMLQMQRQQELENQRQEELRQKQQELEEQQRIQEMEQKQRELEMQREQEAQRKQQELEEQQKMQELKQKQQELEMQRQQELQLQQQQTQHQSLPQLQQQQQQQQLQSQQQIQPQQLMQQQVNSQQQQQPMPQQYLPQQQQQQQTNLQQQQPQYDPNNPYQQMHSGTMSPVAYTSPVPNEMEQRQQQQQYPPQWQMQPGPHGHPFQQGHYPYGPQYDQYGQQGPYGQNYGQDYYNWYYNQYYANWPGYDYNSYYYSHPAYQHGQSWDTASYHSGYTSSRNASEIDPNSRPSSVLENYSTTDAEVLSYNQYSKDYPVARKAESPVAMERLTPLHFINPHLVVRFSKCGGMLVSEALDPKENQKATVHQYPIKNLIPVADLHSFPGPLVRGETSKKSICLLARTKAKEWLQKPDVNKDHAEGMSLLWEFVALLVKHNGVVDGSDIADLLVQKTTRTDSASEEELMEHQMSELQLSPTYNKLPRRFAESQYRDLLLQGSRKEALDHAMTQGLWGHALVLASSVDQKLHHSVMARFLSSLESSDSLLTLYGHLGGRGIYPTSANSIREGTADWKSHLAMLAANHTKNTIKDKNNIIRLGDILAERGNIPAAHLCYLLASVNLGDWSEKSTKISLLGTTITSTPELAAQNEYIQLTEIYEYALRLQSRESYIPSFQAFKFLYVVRLKESGLLHEALAYCEVIAAAILTDPRSYKAELIAVVLETALELWRILSEGEDESEPEFAQALKQILGIKSKNREIEDYAGLASGDIEEVPSNDESVDDTTLPTFGSEQSSSPEELQLASGAKHEADPPEEIPATQQEHQWQQDQHYEWQQQQNWQQQQQQQQTWQQQQQNWQQDQPDSGNISHQQSQDNIYQPNQSQGDYYQQEQAIDEFNKAEQPHAPQFFNPGSFNAGSQQSVGTVDQFKSGYNYQTEEQPQAHAGYTQPPANEDVDEAAEDDFFSAFAKNKKKQQSATAADTVDGKAAEKTKSEKKESKPTNNEKDAQSRSWIGSLWSKLRPSRPKDAYLPDDTDKSIYFDKDLGRWVDKNSSEEDNAPPPPPPTDMELTSSPGQTSEPPPKPSQPMAPQPSFQPQLGFPSPIMNRKSGPMNSSLQQTSADDEQQVPAGPPSKFSLKAQGSGRRSYGSRYVNAFGGSKPVEQKDNAAAAQLFDPMSMGQQPMQFFVPQQPTESAQEATEQSSGEQNSSLVAQNDPDGEQPPQFFNPSQMSMDNSNSRNTRGRVRLRR